MSADEVPSSLQAAAVGQIVAGVLNLTVMWWLSYLGLSLLCGLPTLGLGLVCGFAGMVLFPLGILEMVAGLLVLTDPKGFTHLLRTVAMFEMASILVGAVPSVVVGGVVLSITGSEEVRGWLDG